MAAVWKIYFLASLHQLKLNLNFALNHGRPYMPRHVKYSQQPMTMLIHILSFSLRQSRERTGRCVCVCLSTFIVFCQFAVFFGFTEDSKGKNNFLRILQTKGRTKITALSNWRIKVLIYVAATAVLNQYRKTVGNWQRLCNGKWVWVTYIISRQIIQCTWTTKTWFMLLQSLTTSSFL